LARCTNAAQERHYSPSINASCYRDGKRALNFETGPRGINITVGWAGCGLVVPVEEEEPVRQTGVRESEAPASRWLPRSLSVQGGGPSDSGSLQGRCQCQRRAVRNRTRRLGPPTLGRGNGRRWGDRSHDGAKAAVHSVQSDLRGHHHDCAIVRPRWPRRSLLTRNPTGSILTRGTLRRKREAPMWVQSPTPPASLIRTSSPLARCGGPLLQSWQPHSPLSRAAAFAHGSLLSSDKRRRIVVG
jgi:hypothetical protein